MFNPTDESTPGYYGHKHTALLLLGYQNYFVESFGGPGARAALQVATQMQIWANNRGIRVIHCIVHIGREPFPTSKNAAQTATLMAYMGEGNGKRADEPAEMFDYWRTGNDVVFPITPGYLSAFECIELDDWLRDRGIESLILAGLTTSGHVLRTAHAGQDRKYVVTVIKDGCADPIEGVHDMMVEKVLPNGAYVVTAAEFRDGYAHIWNPGATNPRAR